MNQDKAALRAVFLAARAEMSAGSLLTAAAGLGRHVIDAVRSTGANRICAYVPVGAEPGSLDVLDELRLGGVEVLLPVLRDDLDLDWAPYEGSPVLVLAEHGLRQPAGPRWGLDAISSADVVIVPALAVDRVGNRLGRGGGSYDRALARLPRQVRVVALLHDGELVPEVPCDAHDRPVTHTATPALGLAQVVDRSVPAPRRPAEESDPS